MRRKSRFLLSIDFQQPLPNTQFKMVDLYSGNDIGNNFEGSAADTV